MMWEYRVNRRWRIACDSRLLVPPPAPGQETHFQGQRGFRYALNVRNIRSWIRWWTRGKPLKGPVSALCLADRAARSDHLIPRRPRRSHVFSIQSIQLDRIKNRALACKRVSESGPGLGGLSRGEGQRDNLRDQIED
jgi:hypothetical protein